MISPSLFAFGAAACERLAAEHGTPCFVYRRGPALAQLWELRAALPQRVRVAYAVKANPHPALLAALAAAGVSFDCASLGELNRVARLSVPAERIFFAGPGKRDREIEAAVSRGVRIQAEGLEDLARVDACAVRRGLRSVAVNLRVQPQISSVTAADGNVLGGGGPTAFGIDEEDLDDVLGQVLDGAARCRRVAIRGLHGFAASGELDADRLLAIHRHMMTIARRMNDAGLELRQVDLGGGLGVPYSGDEAPLDVGRLGRGLAELLADNPWFTGELVLEPGRFLAAPCGVYLARVVRTKDSRGERFAILDGGIHHLLRPLLTGRPFPVRAVGVGGKRSPTILAGPLCTALDRLGRIDLPPLSPGDLLAFGMAGAYGATEAMVRFLDHPPAQEIWCDTEARSKQLAEIQPRRLRSLARGPGDRPPARR